MIENLRTCDMIIVLESTMRLVQDINANCCCEVNGVIHVIAKGGDKQNTRR